MDISSVLNFLVKNKSHVNVKTQELGASPLDAACFSGHKEIVNYLIDHGASVNIQRKAGATPLFIAAQQGHVECCQILIENKADVNLGDNNIDTPLHIAAYCGQLECVQYLIKQNADKDQVNKNGQKPIDQARQQNHTSVVDYLNQCKSNTNQNKQTGKPNQSNVPKSTNVKKTPTFELKSAHDKSSKTDSVKLPSPKPKEEPKNLFVGRKVMISYSWSEQEIVLKICEELKRNKIDVWVDVEQMRGYTNDAMAQAVESNDVIMIAMSAAYKKGKNTRKEAEYADSLNKEIVPLLVEPGYQPDGWLGLLIGSRLYYDFSGKFKFDDKIKELLQAFK